MTHRIDFYCLMAALFFAVQIVGNLLVTNTPSQSSARFEKLSLFPPLWVFAIWLVIWGLQGILLYQSYGSGFWTAPLTVLFGMVCLGNVGSQIAGARGWGAALYLAFLFLMLASSFFFLKAGEASVITVPVLKAASQLYAGWSIIAGVVGLGVVLVCDRRMVDDSAYSFSGLALLLAAPVCIGVLWFSGKGDYRILAVPFVLVLVSLAIRVLRSGGRFLKSLHA